MEQEKKLKQELIELIEKDDKLNQTTVARQIGIHHSRIGPWLRGTYSGDNEKIERAVKSFIERYEERKLRLRQWQEISFIETTAAKKVFEIARICHIDGELGVCTGGAGEGKTFAVREYAWQNLDVVLIESDMSYNAKVLFMEFASAIGVDPKRNLHDLFDAVVDKLKGSGRLIIIDEAEHLPYRALELLRRLYDKTEIGILLIGMPRLVDNLRGKSHDFKQLYSRVGIYAKLEGMAETDTEAVVNAALADYNPNGLWQFYHRTSGANMRLLTKLIKRSLRIAALNKMDITETVVKESAKTLIM